MNSIPNNKFLFVGAANSAWQRARKTFPFTIIDKQPVLTGWIILSACILGSALMMFAYTMFSAVNCDENSYIAAGVLLSHGKSMYNDFCYLQMPLLPIIYAFLFTLFKTSNYLLIGRMLSCIFSVLTGLLVASAFLHAFRGERVVCRMVFSACGMALYSLNSIILYTNSLAWNHALPIFCTTAACVILTRCKLSDLIWTFLAGFLCGIALITRSSFIVVGFSLFIALLLLAPVVPILRLKRALVFLVGMGIPLLVVCYYMITAFRPFMFDTIQYFIISGAHKLPGSHLSIGIYDKIIEAVNVFKQVSYLMLLVLVLCALGAGINRIASNHGEFPCLIALIASVAALISAFLVTPMWKQYFACVVPFALVFVAYSFAATIASKKNGAGRWGGWCGAILVVCTIVCLAKGHPGMCRMAFLPKSWATTRAYNASLEVSSKIGFNKKVLTVAPLFALDGGNDVYPEFSTGIFLFRYSHLFSDDQKKISVSVDPDTLPGLLKSVPPDAVLAGFYPDWMLDKSWTDAAGSQPIESTLVKFAVENRWRKIEIKNYSVILYVPPGK